MAHFYVWGYIADSKGKLRKVTSTRGTWEAAEALHATFEPFEPSGIKRSRPTRDGRFDRRTIMVEFK